MGFSERLDAAIGLVSPGWHRARLAERWRTRVIEHGMGLLGGPPQLAQRRYAGASMIDRNSTWSAGGTSANTEIAGSISLLRNRSRQLVRDEGWPNVAVRRLVSNAIGDGLRCTVEHPDENKRRALQALWDRWAGSTDCDADGRLDFYGLQALALRSVIEGGDSLARVRWRTAKDRRRLPLQIQLLEGDHLDTSRDTLGVVGGRVIRQGIEFDATGARVGYHLLQEHPGEFGWRSSLNSVFVAAEDVAHAYRVERSGQVSGVPWGAPTFLSQRTLAGWKEATMVRLHAAACIVAIATGDPLDDPSPSTPGNATLNRPEVFNPGQILYPEGAQSISFSNPPGAQGTETFSHQILLEVAAAYGVPYEVMTGDLSRVNYSSGRMGWLEFGRELRIWRRDVIAQPLCEPVFRWFLRAAELAGLIRDDGEFRANWTPSRREFVDAAKEIGGMVAEVRAGFSTWSEKARESGWSPEELLEEFKRDLVLMDKAGISFDTDPRRALQQAAAPAEKEPDEEQDKPADKGKDKATAA